MSPILILRLITAFVLAILVYMLDRRFGVGIYRWWYDMTRPEPMAGPCTQGFVHNRKTRERVTIATILSTLMALLVMVKGASDIVSEFTLWLVNIPVMVLAFLCGPLIYRVWGKREKLYDVVDRWEQGEIDLKEEIREKGQELGKMVKENLVAVQEQIDKLDEEKVGDRPAAQKQAPAEPAAQPAPVESSAKQESEPVESPEELMQKYLRRGPHSK